MQNVKNRGWVKNAAIIFLAVLLVLTFFSNTIMNRSLPEVAVQGVNSGPVTVRVRGTGVVTALGAYELKADQTRKIQSVLVRAGQEVSAGDVLFVLGEGASEELEQAVENLRQLELSYRRAAAGMPVFNYELDEKDIKAAKKAEDEAKAAIDEALDSIIAQNETLAGFEESLKEKQAILNSALAMLESAKANASERKETQRAIVQEYTIYVTVLDYAKTVLTQYVADNSTLGSGDADGIETLSSIILHRNDNEGGEGNGTEGNGTEGNGTEGNGTEGNDTEGNGTEGNGSEGNGTGSGSENGNGSGGTQPNTPEPIPAMPLSDLHIPSEILAGQREEEKAIFTEKTNQLDMLLAGITTADEQLKKVKNELTTVSWQLANAESQLNAEDPEVAAANADVEIAQADLNELLKKLGPYADEYYAAQEEYEAAKEKRERLEIQLKQTKAANGRSAASSAIELQDLSEQIARAKQKIEELSGGTENQVVAPVGGIIESIGYTAGNTAPKGEILCKIQVPDMGYTLSFSVTNEQARRLRVGDTATVSNYYWGNEILATLSTIQVDPQSPQTNKLLTFDVTGDVNPGSELSIAVGSRSQNYDTIIPNSAIRSDTNGSFVLRLEAKNSPLGNRYFARRVEVTVLAQDDVNAAVAGDFGWGDFVITTSDRPVNAGDQVRMTDNG